MKYIFLPNCTRTFKIVWDHNFVWNKKELLQNYFCTSSSQILSYTFCILLYYIHTVYYIYCVKIYDSSIISFLSISSCYRLALIPRITSIILTLGWGGAMTITRWAMGRWSSSSILFWLGSRECSQWVKRLLPEKLAAAAGYIHFATCPINHITGSVAAVIGIRTMWGGWGAMACAWLALPQNWGYVDQPPS